jgi:hypothetical protein
MSLIVGQKPYRYRTAFASDNLRRKTFPVLTTTMISRIQRSSQALLAGSRKFVTAKPPALREYFYWLDQNGRLYCIDKSQQIMPSGPAYLRDVKALNFYFARYASDIFPDSPMPLLHLK